VVARVAAAFQPRRVIVRLPDLKANEYAWFLAAREFEPKEENPMMGLRGAVCFSHRLYADAIALECEDLMRIRSAKRLRNLQAMAPFCRRGQEAQAVLKAIAAHGLVRCRDGLEISIPNYVAQIDAYVSLFEGLSIGLNDLTQLVLGIDRFSDIIAFDFDARDPVAPEMLRQAVEGAHRISRPIGVCGETPATYSEIAEFLTRLGVDGLSVNPQSLGLNLATVASAETAHQSQSGLRSDRTVGGAGQR
jgi:pyruvate,water dikinase